MLSQTRFFMMMLIFTISGFSISACDSKPAKSNIENPLAGHAKALEKAKDVERQLLESEQRTRDAINKVTD